MKNVLINLMGAFIPTQADWQILYRMWFEKMVSLVAKRFGRALAEDAVSEAFYKVWGCSQTRKLEKQLEPMTQEQLFQFVKQQAMWIAGQMSIKDMAFTQSTFSGGEQANEEDGEGEVSSRQAESIRKSLARMEATLDEMTRAEKETYRRLKRVQDVLWAESEHVVDGRDEIDRTMIPQVRAEVRSFVSRVFREAGIQTDLVEAFVRYVLDEEDVESVVFNVWGLALTEREFKNCTNRLYVAKSRLLKLLQQKGPDLLSDYPILVEYLRDAA